MEEQKSKEVKMQVSKPAENEKSTGSTLEYTKEQLKDICNKLLQDNQYLRQQLQQAATTIKMFNRLDYLLKVVEVASKEGKWHFSESFMESCLKEIEEAINLPKEQPEGKEE